MAFSPSHSLTFEAGQSFNPARQLDFAAIVINASVALVESTALIDARRLVWAVNSGESCSVAAYVNAAFNPHGTAGDALIIQDSFRKRWVQRFTTGQAVAPVEQAWALDTSINSPFGFTTPLRELVWLDYQQSTALYFDTHSLQDALIRQINALIVDVDQATLLIGLTRSVNEFLQLSRQSLISDTGTATPLRRAVCALFDLLAFIYSDGLVSVQDAGQTVHAFLRRIYERGSTPFPGGQSISFVPDTFSLSHVIDFADVQPVVDLAESHGRGGIRSPMSGSFQSAGGLIKHFCALVEAARRPPPGKFFVIVDPERPPPVTPPGHVVRIISTRISYMINHSFTVTLPDGTPIEMETVGLSLDADSYAWAFRGTLADRQSLSSVQPPANADPVQLVITVNGVEFRMLVERVEHSRQFGERRINLSGRSLSALLGSPYLTPQSATQSSELTVQQLAELQLPLGWSIIWDMPTWLVPAGAFSYLAKTPMQVLMEMSDNIGALIKPSRNQQKLTFMPRYPVGPWQFSDAEPDLVVPEAAILEATLRPAVTQDINGVYVHGGEIGGVIGWCRLTGSDGGRLAQTASNALITDPAAARSLGERILAANQTQPSVQSITIPFDNDQFPLAEVGWLVQITIDNVPVRGIINAVSLDVQFGAVRQTLHIGEETPNNWTLFKNLLPRDPLLVATLSITDGLTSLMTLLDGGVVRVRGTGTIGQRYYIRAGQIENDAPQLQQQEIVI